MLCSDFSQVDIRGRPTTIFCILLLQVNTDRAEEAFMNYQQLGDAKSANKAIGVELQATKQHLSKACWSKERYYRNKYKGWRRFWVSLEFFEFNSQK